MEKGLGGGGGLALHTLVLSDCEISSQNGATIMNVVAAKGGGGTSTGRDGDGGDGDGGSLVRSLDLSHNHIDGADTRVVVALQNLATQARPPKVRNPNSRTGGRLAALDLSHNHLGPRGGRAVALMLTKMKEANGGVHTGLEDLNVG